MNSIISPWAFYWISIVDNIRTLLIIVLIVLMIGEAIMFVCTMSDADLFSFRDENVAKEVKNLHQGRNCYFCYCDSSLCDS